MSNIYGCRCGSLIFELVLRFNIEVPEDHIISTIRNAIMDGRLGELNVNASSIIGVPPVIKTPATSPTDKTTTKADGMIFYKLQFRFSYVFPKGLDSTSVTNIFKNTTTLFSLRNMFRCFKHHRQQR